MDEAKYYVAASELLPKAAVQAAEAKRMLKSGEVCTVAQALEAAGISREVFDAYKDKIHPFYNKEIDRTVTVFAQLQDRAGVLSMFLGVFTGAGADILTMTQNASADGTVAVSVTARIGELVMELSEMLELLRACDGVAQVDYIAGE